MSTINGDVAGTNKKDTTTTTIVGDVADTNTNAGGGDGDGDGCACTDTDDNSHQPNLR